MARQKAVSKKLDVDAGTVTFGFGENGPSVTFEAELVVAGYASLPVMAKQLILHGASQKIGDSYASAKDATEGTDIDPTDWARQQVQSTIENIYKGDWTVRGVGGPAVTDLATALSEATGSPVEECISVLASKSKEQKAALRAHPQVAAILARIKRERAEAKEKSLQEKAANAPDLGELLNSDEEEAAE